MTSDREADTEKQETVPKELKFVSGDQVVYPLRGIGSVISVDTIEMLGTKKKFYSIEIGEMTVKIPIERAGKIGLRELCSKDETEEIYKILRGASHLNPDGEGDWKDRNEQLKNKIRFGNAFDLAEVFRDLKKNSQIYDLNVLEKDLLKKTSEMLMQELEIITGESHYQVEKQIRECMKAHIRRK